MTLPVVIDASGAVPQTSTALHNELISNATALAPGLTADLPLSLIDDMAGTGTGGLISCDQMRVESVNNVGVLSANIFMLNILSQQYGTGTMQSAGYTTVPVDFTGPAGFPLPQGFTVSDGTYQYALNDAAVFPTSGILSAQACTATIAGSWAVAIGTVTTLITSVPTGYTVTCTNSIAGTPAGNAETEEEFRSRVWEAGIVTSEGVPEFIRTMLYQVANVQKRLVRVLPVTGGFCIMCGGGGDPYSVAGAIFKSAGDFSRLQASSLNVTGITQANPGVVTTGYTHGYSTGQVVYISGIVGMTALNGVALTITVIDSHNFSIGINTTSYPGWTSGGVVTPNLRNVSVAINDWPDQYLIPYVIPLQQLVTISATWKTSQSNYITNAAMVNAVSSALISYINSLYAGMPINLNTVRDTFLTGAATIINTELITNLTFVFTVNGAITNADSGTNIISGDALSYWYIASTGVTVTESL